MLCHQVPPTTPAQHEMAEITRALFQAVERGAEEITTTEVVLHEVIDVLASREHYAVPPPEIAAMIGLILRMPGFRLPRGDKRVYLRALDLFASHSKLGFADAVVASRVERQAIPLASFDTDFDDIPTVTR